MVAHGLKPSYRPGVSRPERFLAIATAVEAAFILYLAMLVFLTPSGTQEHNPLLAFVLLAIAVPFAWYAADVAFGLASVADPIRLRVIVPNTALLLLCLNGSLNSGPRPNSLLPALVAGAALVVIAGTIRMARTQRSGATRAVRS